MEISRGQESLRNEFRSLVAVIFGKDITPARFVNWDETVGESDTSFVRVRERPYFFGLLKKRKLEWAIKIEPNFEKGACSGGYIFDEYRLGIAQREGNFGLAGKRLEERESFNPIKIHVYSQDLMEKSKRFAKEYELMSRESATVVREFF